MSALLAVLLLAPAAEAAPWRSLLRLEALGGKSAAAGRQVTSGSASWQLGGAARLSPRDIVVPLVSGEYRRLGEIQDIGGEGVVASERLDNGVAVRWVRSLDRRWTVKPSLGFKRSLLRSSSAERLGSGIFDFDKASAGAEVGYAGDGWGARTGFSAYRVTFPRFRAAQTNGISGFGDRVLDFTAYELAAGVERELRPGTRVGGGWVGSMRLFADQRVAGDAGVLADDRRRDLFQQLSAQASQALPSAAWRGGRLESSVGLSAAYRRLDSNQNGFFPEAGVSRARYYDYDEVGLTPSLSGRLGGAAATASYDWALRSYRRRLAQDASGAPNGGLVRQTAQTLSLTLTKGLGGGFTGKLSVGRALSRANTGFEPSGYRYNYSLTSAFAGVSYAY